MSCLTPRLAVTSAEFAAPGVEDGTQLSDSSDTLTAYVRGQIAAAAAADPGTPQYLLFRLSPDSVRPMNHSIFFSSSTSFLHPGHFIHFLLSTSSSSATTTTTAAVPQSVSCECPLTDVPACALCAIAACTQYFGCDASCGGECSVKRVHFNPDSFSLQVTTSAATAPASEWVHAGASGLLEYKASTEEQTPGDTIPDFSQVGYLAGAGLPSEAAVGGRLLELAHEAGDQTSRIQQAIDSMAAEPIDGVTGFRGTVKLGGGTWIVSDTLNIQASGIVLSGTDGVNQGSFTPEAQPTTISATEEGFEDVQRSVVHVFGDPDGKLPHGSSSILAVRTR